MPRVSAFRLQDSKNQTKIAVTDTLSYRDNWIVSEIMMTKVATGAVAFVFNVM